MMKKLIVTILVLSPLFNSAIADSGEKSAEQKRMENFAKTASNEELFRRINSGWSSSYKKVKTKLRAGSSYLVLHSMEPKFVMDLRSADGFRASINNNGLINMSSLEIGHVWMGWRCQTPEGVIEGAAAQTGEHDNQTSKMVKGGWGLSTFKSVFTDGYLQFPELLEEIEFGNDEPGLHALFIEVDHAVCNKAVDFVKRYVFHPLNPRKNYGLEPKPQNFEGAGCGSFGISIAQESGLFGDSGIGELLWTTVRANKSLFGYGLESPRLTKPYKLPGSQGSNSVPLAHVPLMGGFISENWNGENSDDPTLTVMDPELLLFFMRKVYRLQQQELSASDSRIGQKFFNSRTSPSFAYRKFSNSDSISETPEQAEWRIQNGGRLDELIFDESFHPKAKKISEATAKWLEQNHYKARFSEFDSKNPVVILDRTH